MAWSRRNVPRKAGSLTANNDEGIADAMGEYGRRLGRAFQLIDDLLDYGGLTAVIGKSVGDDFRESKITLPVLVAFHAGDATAQAFWRRTIEMSEQTDADLAMALDLIARHGAIRATLERAALFVADAKRALGVFPNSALRQALLAVADFTVSRAR